MTTYTRPLVNGLPATGQVVKAGHVNEPIDQIYDTILAGGITKDQIAAGAVDTAELATAAVTRAKMDGTLPDASAMATSAAPTLDAQLANKKYVDEIDAITSSTLAANGEITFVGGLQIKWGRITDIGVGASKAFDYTDEGLTDFNTVCFQIIISYTGGTAPYNESVAVTAQPVTGLTVFNEADVGTKDVSFIAIGN